MILDQIQSQTAPRRAGTVPPGVECSRALAGEHRRVGRGILAIVLLVRPVSLAIN